MVTGDTQTYCGDHFAVDINTESLCCALETNMMLYVNYISIFKSYNQKEKKDIILSPSKSMWLNRKTDM